MLYLKRTALAQFSAIILSNFNTFRYCLQMIDHWAIAVLLRYHTWRLSFVLLYTGSVLKKKKNCPSKFSKYVSEYSRYWPALIYNHRLGEYAMLFLILMAVMSTGSAEVIAVSSIVIYDVYQAYLCPFRPNLKVSILAHKQKRIFFMYHYRTGHFFFNFRF